ncbi:MAG: 50S ribosomal protein L11 [Candidatus Nanoarchaeia archaeon]|nr:50S ribosomal protein L11 [Candidatus Jingweiarchaeum tengchongense]
MVDGGKATPAPPLGPSISPLGINVMDVVKKINEATNSFSGMKVPVKVIVETSTKNFEIEVGVPATAELLKKELNVQKGASSTGKEKIGNLSLDQIIKIAKIKFPNLNLKSACKQVIGSCVSLGITIDGKNAKELIKEINDGKYDNKLG